MSENIKEEFKVDALKLISESSLKSEMPVINVGDTVKVHVRITEGDKSRIQIFEGTVIAKKHGGISETFTVRRVAHGCGIERVFPVHSPVVEKVEIVRHGKVRRAKLYYLRDRVGKAAKVKEALR
jgi:large subunit ribosomal protein L19